MFSGLFSPLLLLLLLLSLWKGSARNRMEESLNWIYLAHDWDRWLAGVKAVMNLVVA
jgi:hypothetical protein